MHYLRLTSPVNPESLAVYPQRLGSSRHNPYFQPGGYNNLKSGLEDFNTNLCGQGGFPTLGPADANMSETLRSNILAFFLNNGVTAAPPCKQQAPFTFSGETSQFPHVRTDPRPSP